MNTKTKARCAIKGALARRRLIYRINKRTRERKFKGERERKQNTEKAKPVHESQRKDREKDCTDRAEREVHHLLHAVGVHHSRVRRVPPARVHCGVGAAAGGTAARRASSPTAGKRIRAGTSRRGRLRQRELQSQNKHKSVSYPPCKKGQRPRTRARCPPTTGRAWPEIATSLPSVVW